MKFLIGEENYLTLDEVEKRVGLKESSISMRVRFGHFPKPTKLEIRKAWKESDIDSYLEREGK